MYIAYMYAFMYDHINNAMLSFHAVSTANITRVTSSEQPIITTVPGKTTTTISRDRPSIATLNLDSANSSTSSSNDKGIVTVVLTQTRPGTIEQLEINQFIDFTMDKKILTFHNVVTLCLMPLQEKHVLLKQLTDNMEGLQGTYNHCTMFLYVCLVALSSFS